MHGYEVRFCEEYLIDFNASKALVRAGVHGASKPSVNKELQTTILQKENVQKYLAHHRAKMGISAGITTERILNEIAAIAFQDVRQYMTMDENGNVAFRDLNDMPNTAAISSIELASMGGDFKEMGKILKLKNHDKLKALEMLARNHALFTDNVNHTSAGGPMPENTVVNKIIINHRAPGESLQRSAT